MGWFRKALTISTPEPGSYYTVVGQGDFYEWKFTGRIPAGSPFTKSIPPSEIFTRGLLIASAVLPQSSLKETSSGYEVVEDVNASIVLTAGRVDNPQELINTHKDRQKKFESDVKAFKLTCQTDGFIISGTEKPHLYKVAASDDEFAMLANYGLLEEVHINLAAARSRLAIESSNRVGRSYEKADSMRFENAMVGIDNRLPIDGPKMQFVLNMAKIEPEHTRKISWKDCYTSLFTEASLKQEQLKHFGSYTWVKYYSS